MGARSCRSARPSVCGRVRLGVQRGEDAGFGLIEAIVAMAVLSVVSLVVGRSLASGLHASLLGRQQSMAAALISAADSSLEADTAAALATLAATPTATRTTIGGTTYCLSQSAAPSASASLYSFTLTVSWPSTTSCTGAEHDSAEVQVAGS